MKKNYTGIDAVVITFEQSDTILCSAPSSCVKVFANTAAETTGQCTNSPSTTARVWFGQSPED